MEYRIKKYCTKIENGRSNFFYNFLKLGTAVVYSNFLHRKEVSLFLEEYEKNRIMEYMKDGLVLEVSF